MGGQVTNLLAGLNAIDDDEPKEGRKVISFNPAMQFVTGFEVFQWDSKRLGNQPLTSIQALWFDASNVVSHAVGGQSVFIQINGPLTNPPSEGPGVNFRTIQIDIPGNATASIPNVGLEPRQGFILIPSAMPFTLQVFCTLNAVGPFQLNLYNFNVFALGIKHAKDVIKYLDKHREKSHINTGATKS